MAVEYEFKCPGCGHIVTSEKKYIDLWCEVGHEEMKYKRVYSLGGIAFKGSGFYKNDH